MIKRFWYEVQDLKSFVETQGKYFLFLNYSIPAFIFMKSMAFLWNITILFYVSSMIWFSFGRGRLISICGVVIKRNCTQKNIKLKMVQGSTFPLLPPPPLLSQVPLEASNSIAASKKSILITYREALLYLQQFLTPCVDMSNEEERNNFQQLPAKVNLQSDKVSYRVTWITSREQDTPLGVSRNKILILKCTITRPNVLQTTNSLIARLLSENSYRAWWWVLPVLGQDIPPTLTIYVAHNFLRLKFWCGVGPR